MPPRDRMSTTLTRPFLDSLHLLLVAVEWGYQSDGSKFHAHAVVAMETTPIQFFFFQKVVHNS